MTPDQPGLAHAYATAILRRGRDPMPPADFTPDWGDAPRRGKYYPRASAFGLPAPPIAGADVDTALTGAGDVDEPFTLPLLAGMLHHSYGLLGRRLGIQANTDLAALPSYAHANWHRGTASGGGLYPCSVYWIAGPGAGVTPGVYYYAHARHAMQRMLAGDVSARVNAAVDPPQPTGQFLVIGVKYWQNAFKYNNFSYHAVSMDVGTILQTWRLWAGGQGRRIRPVFWFDQAAVGDLLGLDVDDEALFAVVPLTWTMPGRESNTPVRNRHRDQERSRTLLTFDTLRQVNRATADAVERPAPEALAAAEAHPAPPGGTRLPAPAPMTVPLEAALTARRSSFGRFLARPMAADQFAALLRATAADQPLARVYAFVNHVADVPAGSYVYDPAEHSLVTVASGPPGEFLQRNYFLANYNLEQAAVVLVPTVRTHAVLDAVGDRGYNLVNATVGAIAQTFYTAAAALGLGAGVALGFDSVSYVEELGLTDEFPLLIMLAGHDRAALGDYRFELR
ncbi:nitroreductase family protein [Actinoplanes solisilvae]|uniref:nitroreductase family protein n=1 Tax=Actinoplanes solisilvae TaxID=2486853 RepID=UPI000FD901E9|nr:nitroreductase family protein [Actinoplanes solisilvae]